MKAFLVVDKINGVYESDYRPARAMVTTIEDFYESLEELADGDVIVCINSDPAVCSKIEAEYGIN